MGSIEKLLDIQKNFDCDFPLEWQGRKVSKYENEPEYVYIPEGSYFGDTGIILSSDYEDRGFHCDYISAACNMLPKLIELLQTADTFVEEKCSLKTMKNYQEEFKLLLEELDKIKIV